MQAAIRVENISKQYQLGAGRRHAGTRTLREAVADAVKAPLRGLTRASEDRAPDTTLWALKDVSFEVQPGEVVGVIGRNGSGKSTLLKILSRITAPQAGRITLNGRVGSLLEVGTGFHPELSGRENIYLNGSILGMQRREIERQFDDIVEFSGVQRFLETPVKRYSSGMYVRLAFAVAAHLNPEIMLVDEVLAVGDAEFQKRCVGKMQDVAHTGRTVLFVSHNMAAVRQLCTTGVLLSGGKMVMRDTAEKVLTEYLAQRGRSQATGKVNESGVELIEVSLRDTRTGLVTECPVFQHDYLLTVQLRAHQPLPNAALVVRIYDEMETLVTSIATPEEGIDASRLEGLVEATFSLPRLPLLAGKYTVSVLVCRDNDWPAYLEAADALAFEVQQTRVRDAGRAYDQRHGMVRLCDTARISHLSDLLAPGEAGPDALTLPRAEPVTAGRGAESGNR